MPAIINCVAHVLSFNYLQLKEEMKQQRAAANFHARPNTVVHKKPFLPQKSTKPLTGQYKQSKWTKYCHHLALDIHVVVCIVDGC